MKLPTDLNHKLLLLSTLIILPNAPMHAASTAQETSFSTFLSRIGSSIISIKDYCKDHPIKATLIAAPIGIVGFFIGACALSAYEDWERKREDVRRHGPIAEHMRSNAQAWQESERRNEEASAIAQQLSQEEKLKRELISEIWNREPLPVTDTRKVTISKKLCDTFFSQYANTSLPMPQGILEACLHFECRLHPDILLLAEQAKHNVGISEPIFFYQTKAHNHAIDSGRFNRIGLHSKIMLAVHPAYNKYLTPAFKDRNFHEFYHQLYHELYHIKNKDCSRNTSGLGSIDNRHIIRYYEMRTELSALWAMYHFQGIRFINTKCYHCCHYSDDNIHPVADDQQRYDALLFNSLDRFPDANGEEIAKELAKDYLRSIAPHLIEKLGRIMVYEAHTPASAASSSGATA